MSSAAIHASAPLGPATQARWDRSRPGAWLASSGSPRPVKTRPPIQLPYGEGRRLKRALQVGGSECSARLSGTAGPCGQQERASSAGRAAGLSDQARVQSSTVSRPGRPAAAASGSAAQSVVCTTPSSESAFLLRYLQ